MKGEAHTTRQLKIELTQSPIESPVQSPPVDKRVPGTHYTSQKGTMYVVLEKNPKRSPMRIQRNRCWVWGNHVIYHQSCPLCNEQIGDHTRKLLVTNIKDLSRDDKEYLRNLGLSHINTQLIRHPVQPLEEEAEKERRAQFPVMPVFHILPLSRVGPCSIRKIILVFFKYFMC